MVEARRVWAGLGQEPGQGSGEVGFGGAGVGLESRLGYGAGVEDDLYGGWGRGGENLGGERCVLYVVEGEAGAVGSVGLGKFLSGSFGDGVQVSGGDAGFEDEVFVGFGDAAAVIDDYERAVAAGAQGGGDVDVAGAGVAGIAQELEEGVLDGAKTPWTAPEAFGAQEAGEAGSEVPVQSFQGASRRSP